MGYLKRFGLSSGAAFAILVSYALALKLPSQINADVLFAILAGAFACCIVAGLLSAAILRKNLIAMIICAQVVSIALIGIVWRL